MRRLLQRPDWIIPIVVFCIFIAFGLVSVYLGNCDFSFERCWVRWDSANYLDIVTNGHTLYHCTAANELESWCGNAGWAPLYPFFIKIVHIICLKSLSYAQIGGLLSNLFFFAYLVITARICEINTYKIRNWFLLLIVAFCPGNIYYHAVFPLSQAVFFMSLVFYSIKKERYLAAGIAGALAILSYSIGFFLLAAMGCYALYLIFTKAKLTHPFILKTFSISAMGFIALFIYDYLATGHWNAMFMVQSKYGHSINNPLKIFGIRWHNLIDHAYNLSSWIEIQNIIVMGLILGMLIYVFYKKKPTHFQLLAVLYIFFFWFLPYSASTATGLYRNAAMIGPGTTQAFSFPTWVLGLVLVVFVALSFPMGILFILSIIV